MVQQQRRCVQRAPIRQDLPPRKKALALRPRRGSAERDHRRPTSEYVKASSSPPLAKTSHLEPDSRWNACAGRMATGGSRLQMGPTSADAPATGRPGRTMTGDSAQVQAERQQSDLQESGPWADVFSSVADVEATAGYDVLDPGCYLRGCPSAMPVTPLVRQQRDALLRQFRRRQEHANGPVLLIIEEPLRASRGDFSSIYPPEALETVEVNGYPAADQGLHGNQDERAGPTHRGPGRNAIRRNSPSPGKTPNAVSPSNSTPPPATAAPAWTCRLIQIAESLH